MRLYYLSYLLAHGTIGTDRSDNTNRVYRCTTARCEETVYID